MLPCMYVCKAARNGPGFAQLPTWGGGMLLRILGVMGGQRRVHKWARAGHDSLTLSWQLHRICIVHQTDIVECLAAKGRGLVGWLLRQAWGHNVTVFAADSRGAHIMYLCGIARTHYT
jgi:hypothetical protein